jgi:predicted metal-dependent phosphoesterase TrpH
MGLADLHIHTNHSHDGTCTVQAVLQYAAEQTGLDVIAITDHDRMAGALEAEQAAPAYGIEVIPGCEISTAEGHLLAYFIHQPVPAGLSLAETVGRVGEQGGLCVAAHPGARGANSLTLPAIYRTLQLPEARGVLVGIETLNTAQFDQRAAWPAQALADVFQITQVGSSDAHLLWVIGTGATSFPGRTAAELRLALEHGQTQVVRNGNFSRMRLAGSFFSAYLLKRAGLATGI